MSNDNDKSNGSKRNSGDWDNALEEWDQSPLLPALAENHTAPPPAAAPPATESAASGVQPTVRPPQQQTLDEEDEENEEYDEERTIVGEVPAQLLADSARGFGSAAGLGQIFARSTQPTVPMEEQGFELGDLFRQVSSLVPSTPEQACGAPTASTTPGAQRVSAPPDADEITIDSLADFGEPTSESDASPISRSPEVAQSPSAFSDEPRSKRRAAMPAAVSAGSQPTEPPAAQVEPQSVPGPKLLEPEDRMYPVDSDTDVFPMTVNVLAAQESVLGIRATADAEATPLPVGDEDSATARTGPPPDRLPKSVPPVPSRQPAFRWGGERDAAAHLIDAGLREAWERRAAWFADEAAAREDAGERTRIMLAVSELYAMLGNDEKSDEVAATALAMSPSDPLLHRQARQTQLRDRKWIEMLGAFEAETRAAPTNEATLHGLLMQAEICARLKTDDDAVRNLLDLAARCMPSDPRTHLAKLVRELTSSDTENRSSWPDVQGLDALRAATDELRKIRAADDAPAGADEPVLAYEAIARARAALRASDTEAAARALRALADVRGMASGATWLAASLAAQSRGSREQSLRWYEELASGPHAAVAQRLLAMRAVESDDKQALNRVLQSPGAVAFSTAERVALAALFQERGADVDKFVDLVLDKEATAPLGAAALAALEPVSAEHTERRSASARVGNRSSRAALGLARQLSAKLDEDTFAMLVSNLREARPDSVVARLLAVECAVGFGTPEKLVDELAAWGGEAAIGETDRVRGLAAGLVAELLSMRERAHDEYARAHAADPTCEAALRATCAFDPDSCSTRLVELASTLGSGSKAAILALEAALWAGPVADGQYEALVRQCAELDPSLPFANFLGERFARMRGDSDAVLEWVRARREASADPIEASHDRCREAMLMVERDVSVAASLLADASAARPQDIALRSLYERFAPERPDDCLAWRAERVRDTEGPDKARMLLAIATAYERQGMADDAAKMAHLAVEHGAGELAQRCLERCELAGAAISSLTDSLMQVARADHVSAEQRREARERLAELDEKGRNDQASALLWHRAILEETPDYLPSLRRLEHAFVSEGRDEDLEPIASDLTRLLEGPEVDAHAVVAARVRLRDQAWTQLRGLADLAASQRNPSLWSLRQAFNQARAAGDDNALVLLATQLAASADDEGEGATMLVRAAEALARKGQRAEAAELLQAAMKQEPRLAHAHLTLIDVLEASGEYARAAEQIEALARKSVVPSHQVQLWHRAARLWLDKAADLQRGRMALEEACGIDVAYGTVFDDLRAIYAAAEDTTQLAALLERRLNAIVDPNERVEMEVLRAKALAAVGEVTGAKAALAAALDACPDHLLALDAFANVAWNDQDWSGAEQALIRLGRLVTDTEQQIGIYRKLSQIYLNHLPDYERAELALREVLKRNPSDVDAQGRLVDVFRETGNATKGIELCNALLEQAKTQEEKRKHTIQLALIHEQAEGDVPKAKGVLERVYKQAPTWAPSLGALARFYQRHGEEGALNVLLERSANDARRALRTGRFNRDLFSVLETVAALRSNEAMQLVARAAVAAIEGENMLLLPAAGPAALSVDLDDVIAPELLTAPLRALLKRAGHVLDAAFPMDLQALRAGDLPPSVGDLAASVSRVADTTGLTSFSAFVSPALGPTCVPVSSSPAVIIIGASLLSSHDELVRDFLILRALKIVQTRGCVLSRTAPIDLLPVVAAFIKGLAPSYVPSGVDPRRFDDAFERISAVRGASVEPDVAALALELGAGLDNRASTLNVAVNGWGDRAALLAQGSLEAAIEGVAWAGGHPSGPPSGGRDRMTWIGRNAEARELVVFLASDEYGEARDRLSG